MPVKGGDQVFTSHAVAVIINLDQTFTAIRQAHIDAGGACIQRIFDHFFDGSGGALQHFTGGDLIDKGVRKMLYSHAFTIASAR